MSSGANRPGRTSTRPSAGSLPSPFPAGYTPATVGPCRAASVPVAETAKAGTYFDGEDDYLECEDARLALSAVGTIAGWFVWTRGRASLLRDSATFGGWSLGHDLGGHLAYRVAGSDQVTPVAIETLRVGWHHYALVKNGSEVVYYLDGQVIHEWFGAIDSPAVMPWRVMRDGPSDDRIEGMAAELVLYPLALTSRQVLAYWLSGQHRLLPNELPVRRSEPPSRLGQLFFDRQEATASLYDLQSLQTRAAKPPVLRLLGD